MVFIGDRRSRIEEYLFVGTRLLFGIVLQGWCVRQMGCDDMDSLGGDSEFLLNSLFDGWNLGDVMDVGIVKESDDP